MKVLLTGGAGFIGSHIALVLLEAGIEVVVADNLCNSSRESMERVEELTQKKINFYEIDCTDRQALAQVFDEHEIDAAVHLAGLKAVGESVAKPLEYYRNNIDSALSLCEVMHQKGVHRLVFSSSATVYGTPKEMPLRETSAVGVGITNPYGWSKFMIEQILADLSTSDPSWQITLLRYFNPIGAHESGRIGEDPCGLPNNLMPFVAKVASGQLDRVNVFGNDYDTPDGTGVRDYIHVMDLAEGHLAALEHQSGSTGLSVYNLGTGSGVSVLEAIHAFEVASGRKIAYEIQGRRPGDLATVFADPAKAERELHWKATHTLDDACRDAWRWQSQNPDGYRTKLG